MSEKEAAKEDFSTLTKIRERRRWFRVKVYPRDMEEPISFLFGTSTGSDFVAWNFGRPLR